MFVDSHAHLDSPVLQADLEGVLSRARQAGVESILTICCLEEDRHSAGTTLSLLDRYDGLWAAFGVHPHDARCFSDGIASELADLLRHPKALALGEIGLDFAGRGYPEPEVQREAFAWQLDQAERLGLPVIIHQRRSAAAILEQLAGRRIAGVMHCWSLGPEDLDRFLDLGLYVSFAGLLTFKSAEPVRAAATLVPDGRLLVETDAPYLVPRGARSGRRNEPANLPLTVDLLARLRHSAGDEVAALCAENARALFDLPDAA